MRKRVWKGILIWISAVVISIFIIYFLRGERQQLFIIDIQSGFADNYSIFLKIILPIVCLITISIFISMIKRKGNVYYVQICSKRATRKIKLSYWRLFNQYINYTLAVCMTTSFLIFGNTLLNNVDTDSAKYLNTSTIIHAMGSIDGVAYTNSLDAFKIHYMNGERFFEVDLSMTSDNHLVARHDWGGGYQEEIDEEHVPNLAFYLQKPIMGRYTPLSLRDIISLMQQYEDLYIITDTKNNTPDLAKRDIESIVKTAEDMNATDVLKRFVIQVYSIDMYEEICDIYPFNKYIFSLYQIWNGDRDEFVKYCRFCYNHRIATITMSDHRLLDNPELILIAKRYKIDIFVHTVNDKDVAESVFDIGVKGIYTDDETKVQ